MAASVFNVLTILWEALCCKVYMEAFAQKRKIRKKMVLVAAWTIYFIVYCIVEDYFRYIPLWEPFAVAVAGSVPMCKVLEMRYIKIAVLSMLFQGLVLIADSMTLLLAERVFPGYLFAAVDVSYFPLFWSVLCRLVLFCIVLVIRRIMEYRAGNILTNAEWVGLFLVSLISVICVMAMGVRYDIPQQLNQGNVLVYVAVGMAAMDIIVFWMTNELVKREKKLREDEVFREQVRSETAVYHSISENLEKQRKRTHEYKNQLACIRALAAAGQYRELSEYIERLDHALRISTDAIDTNHVIVNAVLNTKYREAVSRGIVFVLNINDLSELRMQEEDIVVILSNLLDNAIEACRYCEAKVLKFKFVLEEGQVVISVKNSIGREPVVEGERFLTTKERDAGDHGMGIRNVIETVEKYEGRYVIDYDQESFLFTILISNVKPA